MSVRFFKIFSGVFLVHLGLLSIIWVGFQAPMPRAPVTFTYQGALPVEDSGSVQEDVWQKRKTSDQFALDHKQKNYLNYWTRLREPSRP